LAAFREMARVESARPRAERSPVWRRPRKVFITEVKEVGRLMRAGTLASSRMGMSGTSE
jgi:hypothetical protein